MFTVAQEVRLQILDFAVGHARQAPSHIAPGGCGACLVEIPPA